MPLQRHGDAAHSPEVASSNAKAVDIAGEPDTFASNWFKIVCRSSERHVRLITYFFQSNQNEGFKKIQFLQYADRYACIRAYRAWRIGSAECSTNGVGFVFN